MANESGKSVQPPGGAQSGSVSPWRNMHDEIDRLMSGFFGSNFGRLPSRMFDFEPLPRQAALASAMTPRVDVTETDQEIELAAELPGMEEKDVELLVQDGVLTIRGEKKLEKEEKKKNYHVVERQYGSFQRSYELPEIVDQSKIAAKFDKGVLTVTLPKTAKAKETTRKIAIGKK
ncbi:MAG: Hsp20/alpha crystallin family protein [Alphaproteobacteria bacterium]|nr:Hsp20/alpha crystallin family protein [Alphaproteobacteria bacterium]